MLSDTARYAVRALIVLAQRDPVSASILEVAGAAGAPRKYLEAVLLRLKRDGILSSASAPQWPMARKFANSMAAST